MADIFIRGTVQRFIRLVSTDEAQTLDMSADFPEPADGIHIECEGHPVRIGGGMDGTVPTQGAEAVGILLVPGQIFQMSSRGNLSRLQYISETAATPGILQVAAIVEGY